jgi:hypothetical protein
MWSVPQQWKTYTFLTFLQISHDHPKLVLWFWQLWSKDIEKRKKNWLLPGSSLVGFMILTAVVQRHWKHFWRYHELVLIVPDCSSLPAIVQRQLKTKNFLTFSQISHDLSWFTIYVSSSPKTSKNIEKHSFLAF